MLSFNHQCRITRVSVGKNSWLGYWFKYQKIALIHEGNSLWVYCKVSTQRRSAIKYWLGSTQVLARGTPVLGWSTPPQGKISDRTGGTSPSGKDLGPETREGIWDQRPGKGSGTRDHRAPHLPCWQKHTCENSIFPNPWMWAIKYPWEKRAYSLIVNFALGFITITACYILRFLLISAGRRGSHNTSVQQHISYISAPVSTGGGQTLFWTPLCSAAKKIYVSYHKKYSSVVCRIRNLMPQKIFITIFIPFLCNLIITMSHPVQAKGIKHTGYYRCMLSNFTSWAKMKIETIGMVPEFLVCLLAYTHVLLLGLNLVYNK